MVIPLRTIFYGIPILLVGVLAALPFRRLPEPGPAEGIEQPLPVDDWAIEPIQAVSVEELADWERERRSDPSDPMKSLAESMPPIADSYQAVAVPMERPAKIADRFSAVARNQRVSADRLEPLGPLAGHPASFASTGIPRSMGVAQPYTGWRTAIPIGRAENNQETLGDSAASDQFVNQTDGMSSEPSRMAAPAEASSTLPPPRPSQNQSPSDDETAHEPWPTLAELARAKRAKEDAPHTSESKGPREPSHRPANDENSAIGRVTPASKFSDLDLRPSSIGGKGDDTQADRERFFIREPRGERG